MDINAIFDTLGKASKFLQIKDQYQNKLKQIKSVQSKRCRNCVHWMKSTCVPEKKLGQFKSMNSLACKSFILAHNSKCLIEEFTKDLHEIKVRLNKII
ncbi:hypothetical protein KAU11_00440 [Candidatus Babeliales bacterium]|nr:hypothetical protein [Candidatus Babeliales bacterium]